MIPWRRDRLPTPVFLGFLCGSAGKEYTCNEGDLGSVPEVGRSPGEGKSYPLQYSCLENTMDRGSWYSYSELQSMGLQESDTTNTCVHTHAHIHTNTHVEVISFYSHFLENFNHKWALNFVKIFSASTETII